MVKVVQDIPPYLLPEWPVFSSGHYGIQDADWKIMQWNKF